MEFHEYTLKDLLELFLIILVILSPLIGIFSLLGWIIKESLK